MESTNTKGYISTVIAGALGYFVDIYDLLLFSIVRSHSLQDLGITKNQISISSELLNRQLLGLAIGGLLWGIIGDKMGRIKILFGSIILYSIANIFNAYITDIEQYKLLRFICGLGLAGELGAGVTLVSESLSIKNRGFGTMIIASVGCIGVIFAIVINNHFGWRTSYIIGGVMGLLILVLRFKVAESELYKKKLKLLKTIGEIF